MYFFGLKKQDAESLPPTRVCVCIVCVPIYTSVPFQNVPNAKLHAETPPPKPFDDMHAPSIDLFLLLVISIVMSSVHHQIIHIPQPLYLFDRWMAAGLGRSLLVMASAGSEADEGAGVVDRELAALRLCCM